MSPESIRRSVDAAREFLTRAGIALSEADGERWFVGTKASGALRRASMDLTRSLAEMRSPKS